MGAGVLGWMLGWGAVLALALSEMSWLRSLAQPLAARSHTHAGATTGSAPS